tara:strand:- start:2200 stop:2340 length:141 start_codon:yes stop_codon:yes gene_type:complete
MPQQKIAMVMRLKLTLSMDQLSDQSKTVGQFDDHSSQTITPFALKS